MAREASLTPSELEPIGSKVRRLRMACGMAQERLALAAKVDQSSLSKFERGSRVFGQAPLRRIADALGMSLDDLVTGSDFGRVFFFPPGMP